MRFVPYPALGETPNIMVDGSPTPSTVLTLSHWPKSGTPAALRADLSAQIAFNYLDRPELHVETESVSNNHFDQDGLVGVFALLEPEAALARRDLLVDVAAAGDFATYRDRKAARVAFALAAMSDAELSPLAPAFFKRPYPELAGALYQDLLPRLAEIVDHPDRFRRLWQDDDALLERSEKAVRSGEVHIIEMDALDLAIVSVPESMQETTSHRFASAGREACHSMAIHNATERLRLIVLHGRRYELRYRYESWVQLVSRRPAPRADLDPLAKHLTRLESGGVSWTFDGVDVITPVLRTEGGAESSLPPEMFVEESKRFLARAPAAWDPYDDEAAP